MFKKKLAKPEQGFTIIEVLTAILIAIVFVTVAMQMTVIATMFRVRAQESAEATTWIQEDLEDVKFLASQLEIKNVANMTATDDLITINSHGLANGDIVVFDGDGTMAGGLSKSTTYYVVNSSTNTFKVASTSGGAAIDLTSDSTGTLNLSSTSISTCNGSSATDGYADSLRDSINDPTNSSQNRTSVDITETSSLTRKEFILTRNINPDSSNYKVLQLNYTVTPSSSGSTIASFYTEVLPNAALYCPTN
jgi:Tfp pilus assembly protein PilV